ncbi:LysR family transcriptional regulator [Clostridium sp. MSJ-8]|uniref:LysR family transcriptional regulator n=1 Tax=Clostridium sp. MSJ-8 TaxID=2841510 RepID=UPI001C0E9722|nr:LysR family transcriptional regulator [Clostridium sp. MSJ-8]MBU5487509.1 LysR family transcriptional regulator [Clostridium sp. MSJ-8]
MLNLNELEQLISFADNKTLSKAAESLHISQPTITRTMQHIEDDFGVDLFIRGKNKIELNETGRKAVEYARKLLYDANNAIKMVQEYDKKLHTITIETCAPAPLWSLLPTLSAKYSDNSITSKLSSIKDIINNVLQGDCDIGVIPFVISNELIKDVPFIQEKLSVCVPIHHKLAEYDELSFEQLNGFNCLLRDKIGFWTELCYEKMPASKFLIQSNEFDLKELIRTSTLLCFTTNLSNNSEEIFCDRKIIPIIDEEANVKYHLICKNDKYEMLDCYA